MKNPVSADTMKKRYSCRSYTGEPLSAADREKLGGILKRSVPGPFGSSPVFKLIAAGPGDSESLRGLGTYGFIRKPAGFIVGAVNESPMYLEDFGYCMESIILQATAMDLGTCWLGGTFTKSSFAGKAGLGSSTEIPAVTALGYIADKKTITERLVRSVAGSDKRKPAGELFYGHDMKEPDPSFYGTGYGAVLEMVRIAPSASNKQPWRIVRDISGKDFHLFLERTKGYNDNRFVKSDLQRVDMGIAMCHFEAAAENNGLNGMWTRPGTPELRVPSTWEYIASWKGK